MELKHLLLTAILASAPALRAATPLDSVAMVRETKMDIMEGSMSMGFDSYVLFKGGIMHVGLPEGPPSSWDATSLAATSKRTGKWSESGGVLRLILNNGQIKETKDWFRMTPGKPGQTLDGVWSRASSITQQSAFSRQTASAIRTLTLRPDGTFDGRLAGGASHSSESGSMVATSRQSSTGKYRIEGWEIEFQYEDGRTAKVLFCASSDNLKTLLIGGARLVAKNR